MKLLPSTLDEWIAMLLAFVPGLATGFALAGCPWTACYLFAAVFLLLITYIRRDPPWKLAWRMATELLGRLAIGLHLVRRPVPPRIPMSPTHFVAAVGAALGMDPCHMSEHPERNFAISFHGRRNGQFQRVFYDEHELPMPPDERAVEYVVAKFKKAYP